MHTLETIPPKLSHTLRASSTAAWRNAAGSDDFGSSAGVKLGSTSPRPGQNWESSALGYGAIIV